MLSGYADILMRWAKDRLETSNFQVTESKVLYADYVKYHSAITQEKPLPDYEWGIYISQLFGYSHRKKIQGRIARVRALVLKP